MNALKKHSSMTTQAEIAALSGLSIKTIRRIERGEVYARLETRMKIQRAKEILEKESHDGQSENSKSNQGDAKTQRAHTGTTCGKSAHSSNDTGEHREHEVRTVILDNGAAANYPCGRIEEKGGIQPADWQRTASVGRKSEVDQKTFERRAYLSTLQEKSSRIRELLRGEIEPIELETIFIALNGITLARFDVDDWQRRYWACKGNDGCKNARRIIRDLMVSCGAANNDGNASTMLQRARGASIKERPNRKPDARLAKAKVIMLRRLAGVVKREQENGPRKDVERAFKDTCALKTLVKHLLTAKLPDGLAFKDELQELWNTDSETGEIGLNPWAFPTLKKILEMYTEKFGFAHRLENNRKYQRLMVGFDAPYAGSDIQIDATRNDVYVEGPWNKGERWSFEMCDVASGMAWAVSPNVTSEHAGWHDENEAFGTQYLFDQLTWAPERLYADLGSGVFGALFHLKEGDKVVEKLPLSLIGFLGLGAELKTSKPETPTGKAHIERAIGITKNEFFGLMAKQAFELERAGQFPCSEKKSNQNRRRRRFSSENLYQNAFSAAMHYMNTQMDFKNSGKSRAEWFEFGAAIRNTRKLISNKMEVLKQIAPKIRVCALNGTQIVALRNGDEIAKLNTPVDADQAGGLVLMVPGGLRESDTVDLVHCYCVTDRNGLKKVTYCEGRIYTAMREYGRTGVPRPMDEYRPRRKNELESKRADLQRATEEYKKLLPLQREPERIQPAALAVNLSGNPSLFSDSHETLEERLSKIIG